MQKIKYLTILIPLLVWVLLFYFLSKSSLFFGLLKSYIHPLILLGLLVAILFITFYFFLRKKNFEVALYYLIFPFNLEISLVSYLVIQTNVNLIRILLIFNSVLLYLFFRFMVILALDPKNKQANSIFNNIVSIGCFVSIFFYSYVLYSFSFYLKLSMWQLVTMYLLGSGATIYFVLRVYLKKHSQVFFYTIFCVFILVEIAWSLSFLPIYNNSTGLILSIFYYTLIGITRLYVDQNLNKKILKFYLSIGLLSILLILLTSSWM